MSENYRFDGLRIVGLDRNNFNNAGTAMEQVAQHHGRQPYDEGFDTHLYTFNLGNGHSTTIQGLKSERPNVSPDNRQLQLYIQGSDLRSALVHLMAAKSSLTGGYEANVIWDPEVLAALGLPEVSDKTAVDMMTLFSRLGDVAAYSMLTTSEEIEPSVHADPKGVERALLEVVPLDLSDLQLPGILQ